jgi:hypothetical protein
MVRFRNAEQWLGHLLVMLCRRCHLLKPQSKAAQLLLFDPLFDSQLLVKGWQLLRQAMQCGKEGAQQLLDQGAAYAQRMDQAGAFAVLSRSQLNRDMSSTASSCSLLQQKLEVGACDHLEWLNDKGVVSDDCSECSFSSSTGRGAGSNSSSSSCCLVVPGQGKELVGVMAAVEVAATGSCK